MQQKIDEGEICHVTLDEVYDFIYGYNYQILDNLKADAVLAISDTNDMSGSPLQSDSIGLQLQHYYHKPLNITQTDIDGVAVDQQHQTQDKVLSSVQLHKFFSKKHGITKRNYQQADNTHLSPLASLTPQNVIVGRGVMCVCKYSNTNKMCGGVGIEMDEQKKFLQGLLNNKPKIVMLSAHLFSGQHIKNLPYDITKNNIIKACTELKHQYSDYELRVINFPSNPKKLATSGYMVLMWEKNSIILSETYDKRLQQRLPEQLKTNMLREINNYLQDGWFSRGTQENTLSWFSTKFHNEKLTQEKLSIAKTFQFNLEHAETFRDVFNALCKIENENAYIELKYNKKYIVFGSDLVRVRNTIKNMIISSKNQLATNESTLVDELDLEDSNNNNQDDLDNEFYFDLDLDPDFEHN